MKALLISILLMLSARAGADVVYLKGGGKLDCLVVQQSTQRVAVLYGSGFFRFDRSMVDRVEIAETTPEKPSAKGGNVGVTMPTWLAILRRFGTESWADDLKQIPATVIDDGSLKHVPYKSQRSDQYEFNVYGDPDSPAGFELGVYGYRIHSDEAKKACVESIAKLVNDAELCDALRSLSLAGESKIVRGVTLEITPTTAKDAYGGWWVSVYREDLLEKSRATDEELRAISVPLKTEKPPEVEPGPKPSPKPTEAPKKIETAEPTGVSGDWSPSDLKQARSSPSGSTGGRVYVRGYVKKDGTYVAPYSRKSPRK